MEKKKTPKAKVSSSILTAFKFLGLGTEQEREKFRFGNNLLITLTEQKIMTYVSGVSTSNDDLQKQEEGINA